MFRDCEVYYYQHTSTQSIQDRLVSASIKHQNIVNINKYFKMNDYQEEETYQKIL